MRLLLSVVFMAFAVTSVRAQTPSAEPPGATPISDAVGATVGVRVPGYLSYSYPDRDALDISPQSGVAGWKDAGTRVVWYGDIKTVGALLSSVEVRLPVGEKVR